MPTGVTVAIECDAETSALVESHLSAHAQRIQPSSEADWTIRRGAIQADELQPLQSWNAFGEKFLIGRGADGRTLIRLQQAADQIWDLSRGSIILDRPTTLSDYAFAQSLYAAARLAGLLAVADGTAAVMHSASVVIDDRAILICGGKGAGKTTLALALLDQGAAYLASDRTIVWSSNGEVLACGWTGTFRLAPESLQLAIRQEKTRQSLSAYMSAHSANGPYWFGSKFRFPPKDLLEICAATARQPARLGLLVDLQHDPSSGSSPIALTARDTCKAWRQNRVEGSLNQLFGCRGTPLDVPPNNLPALRLPRASPHEMARQLIEFSKRRFS